MLKSAPEACATSVSPCLSASVNRSYLTRSRAMCSSVRFSVPAAKPAQASSSITSTRSRADLRVNPATLRVRFGEMSTRPSAASCVIASRTGVMLMPSRAASSASLSSVPGGSCPERISSRSCRATASRRVSGTSNPVTGTGYCSLHHP